MTRNLLIFALAAVTALPFGRPAFGQSTLCSIDGVTRYQDTRQPAPNVQITARNSRIAWVTICHDE